MASEEPQSSDRAWRTAMVHFAIGAFVGLLYRASRIARVLIRTRSFDPGRRAEILLTGTFNSEAWIMAFLRPIAMAENCRSLVLVTTFPVRDIDGVTVVHPSGFLRKALGDVPARLLTFVWQAVSRRPLLVGGFHISINALVAELAARMSGSRSLYICVGGPIEIVDGGLWGESRFFSKLRHADPGIEEKLLRTVRQFDAIASMGNKAVDFFAQRGVDRGRLRIVTGGVDSAHFSRPATVRDVDIVFVGRLVEIKCVDLLLHAVRLLPDRDRRVTVRIVGDGPEKESLVRLSKSLDIVESVTFVGFTHDVAAETARAKCFVLTSRSEGLSLALAEAMLAGAVPVVADVGDLGDLVEHGVNGYLVRSRMPQEFADCLQAALSNESRRADMSAAAITAAMRCDFSNVARDWDALLESLSSD